MLDLWLKEIAPSTELRKWFGHDAKRWSEFQRRYRAELRANREAVDKLRGLAERRRVTLLYGANSPIANSARTPAIAVGQNRSALSQWGAAAPAPTRNVVAAVSSISMS
jgi:uncharacterized protein YeaO (DUF488 family)